MLSHHQELFQEAIAEARLLDSEIVVMPRWVAERVVQRREIQKTALADFIAQALYDAHRTAETGDDFRIGGKIPAIKAFRVATDLGLKEAKDAIEAALERASPFRPRALNHAEEFHVDDI